MRKIMSIAALVLGLGAFTNAGAAVINGVNWANVYDPDVSGNNALPNVPPNTWTLVTAGNGTASITSNYLTISSNSTLSDMQYYSNTTGWDMTSGMSVEARVSVTGASLAAGAPIAAIRVGNASKYIYITFDQTKIFYGVGGDVVLASGLDLSAFTTMRLTLTSALDLNIYVNNSPTPIGTLTTANFVAGAGNNLLFGDPSGFTVGGTSNWDYIAYTAGIYPVPEAGSIALLSLGLLPVCFALHRKRRSGSSG
jgi:hypothetical protein